MELIQWIALIGATAAVGLMAGFFFAFSASVMHGLARVDDRTFVAAFQSIDRAVMNPVFLLTYMGALVLPVVSAALTISETPVLLWALAAFVLYLAVVVITARVHLPRNNALRAAGDPDQIDTAAARERFGEAAWLRWNTVRAVLTLASLGCLIAALIALA